MNNEKKITNTLPKLTEAQMIELYHQEKEVFNKTVKSNPDILQICDIEDLVHDHWLYQLEKRNRNRNNFFDLKESYSEKHFKNTLYFDSRNAVKYRLRQTKIKNQLNQVYLSSSAKEIGINSANEDTRVIDVLPDKYSDIEIDDTLDYIFSKIDDANTKPIFIKYKEDKYCSFNYKNFMKLYYLLNNGKKLTSTIFKGFLFDSNTGKELKQSQISNLIKEFKNYLIDNNIFNNMTLEV